MKVRIDDPSIGQLKLSSIFYPNEWFKQVPNPSKHEPSSGN